MIQLFSCDPIEKSINFDGSSEDVAISSSPGAFVDGIVPVSGGNLQATVSECM